MRRLLFLAVFLVPSLASADAGDLQLELAGGYRTRSLADVLVGGTIGLSDFFAARARVGARLGDQPLAGRLELTVAYAFDVLTLVPELSAGVALDVDEVDAILTGLAFLSLRRYVSRDGFVALELGGELGPDDRAFLARLVWGF